MDYIDSMENYYKDDAELKLFDSLSTVSAWLKPYVCRDAIQIWEHS